MILIKSNWLFLLLLNYVMNFGVYGKNIQTTQTLTRRGKGNASIVTPKVTEAGLVSIFSPRMDFDQWKPLTGRGDPLQNDPTYDYDPPVLDRVHYWADETILEQDRHPERKSEVLMLGVSSRKPSVTPRPPPLPQSFSSRQPSLPLRKQHTRLQATNYEDFSYKLSDQYPLTILVPPPPPPPGQQPPLFIHKDKFKPPIPAAKLNNHLNLVLYNSTTTPHYSTSFALQEANLIYQSSTTSQNWITEFNETKPTLNNDILSDYAGWGPTTPIDENKIVHDIHNFILNDQTELVNRPNLVLNPIPLKKTNSSLQQKVNYLAFDHFIPTVLPTLESTLSVTTNTPKVLTTPTEHSIFVPTTEKQVEYKETTMINVPTFETQPITSPTTISAETEPVTSLLDMLGPMMSMPLVDGPERIEDNLYAHASQNKHVFQATAFKINEIEQLKSMQTMQPPPPTKPIESTTTSSSLYVHTHDPYLHMRYTAPSIIIDSAQSTAELMKSTTETPTVPMYLIIQGHSKVKTYGSKPIKLENKETESNEVSKDKETNEVKHLHPLKEKLSKNHGTPSTNRASKAHNLKSLVYDGLGSIEIQETDIGIKYDVSDGSDVPEELYKKGAVYSEKNDYTLSSKSTKQNRTKRQIDLEDLLPFDEDSLEEYVYNYLEGKKNDSSITGLIAQAVTSDTYSIVDELEDEES